nr:MAG TPA: hypothetical protein [Caudoviricetes sp.]
MQKNRSATALHHGRIYHGNSPRLNGQMALESSFDIAR